MKIVRSTTIISKLNWAIALILVCAGVLISLIIHFFIQYMGESYLKNDVKKSTEIILQAMEITAASNKNMERKYDLDLYHAAKNLAVELRYRKIDSISDEELRRLSRKWKITEISLLVPDGEGFEIIRSTDPKEIGLKTKDWGYWNQAYQQLWDRKEVRVGRGFSLPNFWAGPITDSTANGQFYKYSHYYDGTTDFLISPFISYDLISPNDYTQELINKLSSNHLIKGISIINIQPYIYGEKDIVTAERDVALLYGDNRYALSEDKGLITQLELQKAGAIRETNFIQDNHLYRKYYIRLDGDNGVKRVAMFTISLESYQELKMKIISSTISVFLIAILLVILIIQWITRKQLKPIQQVVDHVQKVSRGDFSGRLAITSNNEFATLARQINDMTQKMDAMFSTTEETYQQQFHSLLSSFRSLRHDYQSHLQVIAGLIQIGSYEKAREYIYSLGKDIHILNTALNVNNPALSVLLHAKWMQAHANQIETDFKIGSDSFQYINSTDLIKILSNLIDNAFDSTIHLAQEKRKVNVLLKKNPDAYQFVVSNACEFIPPEQLATLFQIGYSTKQERTGKARGYGLAIVKSITEKYKGDIQVESKDNWIHFQILIPIRGKLDRDAVEVRNALHRSQWFFPNGHGPDSGRLGGFM